MSEKSKSAKAKYAFVSFNEKICFSKEISSIGSIGTVRLLKGGVAKFLNSVGRLFAYASTRTYGSFLLSFGLVSLFLQFAEFYFKPEPGDAFSYIIISAIVALFGIPLLIFDRPMCIALQDFVLTDYLFFEFFSIKRMHRGAEHKGIKMLGGIFLGFIPAVVSFFIPIMYVIAALILLVVALVAFMTPEFPMILMILTLPYISLVPYADVVLACVSFLTFLSYALKVIIGKRVHNFSVYDIVIFTLVLTVFIGGLLGEGNDSIKNSLVFIALLLSYFPANNLIVNRRLADLTINAVVISSIPIAVLSIIEFVVENVRTSYTLPDYSTPGVSVFFASSEALSAFLLVSAVLSVAYAIEKRRRWEKTLYFFVSVLEIAVLGLTMQPFVWLAILLGIPAYFIITSKNIPIDLIILLVILPLGVLLLSVSSLDSVYSFLKISPSFSGILAGYTEAFDLFLENAWLGVGIGAASYNAATGSNQGAIVNTPLGIITEMGAFALALFAALILILFRQLSYFRRFMTNSEFTIVKDMSALAVTVLLFYGNGAYIFADFSVLSLFFIVFGVSTSVMRSARKEHDDRLSYYGDSRSSESSVIDINIR